MTLESEDCKMTLEKNPAIGSSWDDLQKTIFTKEEIAASELLELFQWKKSEEVVEKSLQEIREELADVFMYSFMLADNLNLDVEEIIKEKIEINAKKYPVELSKGSNKKYTELEK